MEKINLSLLDNDCENLVRQDLIKKISLSARPIVPVAVYRSTEHPFPYKGCQFVEGPTADVTVLIKPDLTKLVVLRKLLKIMTSMLALDENWIADIDTAKKKLEFDIRQSKSVDSVKK